MRSKIFSLLANLIDFLNDDKKYPLDPLLKMAIGHFQFEAIHPFRDGNGRTGRIFNIHYLTKKGLLDYPILYLSRYTFYQNQTFYFCWSICREYGKKIFGNLNRNGGSGKKGCSGKQLLPQP